MTPMHDATPLLPPPAAGRTDSGQARAWWGGGPDRPEPSSSTPGTPQPGSRLRRDSALPAASGGRVLVGALLALILTLGTAHLAAQTADEKGVLAGLISRALSTPATRVSIGSIDGALSSDATIRNIEIQDRDGVWLRLDRARIVWRRLALLQRRLEIDRLEVDTLDVRRRPVPAEGAVAGENQPLLPELPVRVEVKAFRLAQLAIGEPILGTAARVSAEGEAKLGNPDEGLDLRLDARRLDAGGQATIRLGLVPTDKRLNLSIILDEPAGGILARAANIPGLPPVKLDLGGSGVLDNFKARLGFTAGDAIGAEGDAVVTREGAARRIGLDLAARISGLLPDVAAPVFAGTTKLTGSATYGDDGAITIPGLNLVAAAARLDVAGSIGAGGQADLRITAASLPNAPGTRTAVSGAEIRRLAFDGRVTGAMTSPTVRATLEADDARLPAGRLGRLTGSFDAAPGPADPDGRTRLALAADLRATGLVLADPARARAVGGEAALTLRGTGALSGTLDVERLELRTPTLNARYAGRLGSDELRGRAEFSRPDLPRFGGRGGLDLRGGATGTAHLEGTPRANRYNATLASNATRFASGIAPVDGVLDGRLDLAGTVRLTPTGGYAFEELRLAGAHGSGRLDGIASSDSANVTLTATLPDLKRADPRLSGRAALTGQLTGSLARPDVTGRLAISDAGMLGRPVPRLVLEGTARDLTGALDARVTLDGEVDRKPARGTVHVARPAGGGTVVDGVDVAIGSVTVRGGATLDAQNLATGQIAVDAGNLDDLSPLLLQRVSGMLKADVALAAPAGGQDAQIRANGSRIAGFGVVVDRVSADLRATDLYRRPAITGTASADEVTVGGERVSRVRLAATPVQGAGQGSAASDVTLTAQARGFDLDARARVVPGDRTRIEVSQFGASRGRERVALAGPATVTLVEGGAEIRNLAFGFGAGRLALDGTAGSRLDLRVAARALPLSAASIFAPGLGFAGTLNGEAQITGTPSAPTGDYRARIDGLAAPQTRDLGLPPIDVTANGRLSGGRATLDALLAAGRAGQLRITGSVPVGDGALDVAIRGNIDAGVATTRTLAAGGRRLTGRVDVDARVGGTLAAPQASGSATLAGGTFTDALQGTRLEGIRARLVARGEEVTIENASATARNGGTLSASGRIRLDPGAGFPGQIRFTGQGAELIRSDVATAVADLSLDLSGPLAQAPRVSGRVGIVSLDVTIPERLSATLGPLPGTRHRNLTPQARARLALDAKRKGKGGRPAPAFDATLDITLDAPGRISVRGRGLVAELGGRLRLTGTLSAPRPVGAFDLRNGRLQIVSSRLDFTRGRLTFAGDLTPELDFLASTSAGGATIGVAVTGSASDPAFEFTSSPDLPRDEILSRLLFNSPSGQLTTGQALALAQAAAQFSGGDSAFEDLRRSLGLNGLDINLGAGSGVGVGISRQLNDRISVGVKAGATPAATGVGVDVRITDEVRVKGDVGSNGAISLGVGAEYEW